MIVNFTRIPWNRYWCPLGGPIETEDGTAFLADPETQYGRYANPNIYSIEALFRKQLLVLCGDPGMGKTDAIEDLLKIRTVSESLGLESTIHVDWKSCRGDRDFDKQTIDSPKWNQWLRSESRLTLAIDAVDEGRLVLPNFLEWLTQTLRQNVPCERLQLILTCRSQDWSSSIGDGLAALWQSQTRPKEEPEGYVFELCPLARTAVALAARTWLSDPDSFLTAMYERHLTPLAARPVTLKLLVADFARNGGVFPGGFHELYNRACLDMCREPEPTRSKRLRAPRAETLSYTPEKLNRICQRIAAGLLLGAKNAVYIGNLEAPTEEADLSIADLASGVETYLGEPFELTSEAVQAALGTQLFDAKGRDRFGFQHQTFAECLAAKYIATLPFTPLRVLLCQSDAVGEYVIPQLSELAAWVAVENPAFQFHLMRIQPELLLRHELQGLSDQTKSDLIDAILFRAGQGHYYHNSRGRQFYQHLSHACLASQLRKWISDPVRAYPARDLALTIAQECKVFALLPDVLAVLRRREDNLQADAESSLDDLACVENASDLIEIVTGTFQPAPSPRAKSFALKGLMQTVWSFNDALPHLKSIGRYLHHFDWWFAGVIHPKDVFPALGALEEWGWSLLSREH